MLTMSQAPQPVGVRQRIRMDSKELWVALDPGNSDVKAMLRGNFGSEVVFPHAVRKPTTADYERTEAAYQNRPVALRGSAIFRMDDQGYIIGQHAQQVGSGKKLLGAEKYRRDHLGALLCAALVQLAPDGHQNVKLVVAHPAKLGKAVRDGLYNSVTGRFAVRQAGHKADTLYKVTEVILIEEPVCDFQTFVLTQKGTTYQRPVFHLQPGMQFLIVNIGGWISHMVPGVVTRGGGLEINIDNAEPINSGILHVMNVFEAEVKDVFADRLARVQTLPRDMIQNALMQDAITISGSVHDCTQQVQNAMGGLMTALSEPYFGQFAAGTPFNAIVVGGGGGGMALDYLIGNLFNHGYVYPAEDDLENMRFSVVRGAMKGLEAYFLATKRGQ